MAAGIAGMALDIGIEVYAGHLANEAFTPEVNNVLRLEEEINSLSASPLPETARYPGMHARYAAEVRQEYDALIASPDIKAAMKNYYAKIEMVDSVKGGTLYFVLLIAAGGLVRGDAEDKEKRKQGK